MNKENIINLLTDFATELMILECEDDDSESLEKKELKLKREYATKIKRLEKNEANNTGVHS